MGTSQRHIIHKYLAQVFKKATKDINSEFKSNRNIMIYYRLYDSKLHCCILVEVLNYRMHIRVLCPT